MSDDKPDCCECRLERSYAELVDQGGNSAVYYPVANDDLSGFNASPDDQTARVRGSPAGEFGTTTPVKAVVHSDWCKNRPTKAIVALLHDTVAPNGTLRVFVEGARDFSKYVWAEMEYQAGVAFPDLDDRYHTPSGVATTGGGYGQAQVNENTFGFPGPLFGISNGLHVPAFLSLEDPDVFIKSPWPLFRPTRSAGGSNFSHLAPGIVWVGTRRRISWGYRENNEDTVLGSVAFFDNHALDGPLFPLGALAIGCNWSDIAEANPENNVRCGVEILRDEGNSGYHGYFRNITQFGFFTIPFELPRSFFVDANASGDPKPALAYRLIGLEATAPTITVPVGFTPQTVNVGGIVPASWTYGDSTQLKASWFESIVTCGARRAAVFIPPSLQSDSGTLPAGPVGPAARPTGGIIRDTAPLFVRRDDLNERSHNHVANADSWHATHLVRAGSPLAGRNVLHNLNIEIDPCEFEAGNFGYAMLGGYISPGPLRAALVAYGSDFQVGLFGGQQYNLVTNGTRFSVQFASDTSDPEDHNFPEAYLWDAISGSHTLTPVGPNDEQLVPNAYHVFYSEPRVQVTSAIVTPDGYTGSGGFGGPAPQLDPIGDLVFAGSFVPLANQEEVFADYESYQCPAKLRDYRGEWAIDTFNQIWATTEINTEPERVGPRDIDFEDSGMTTENYDKYASSSHRVDYVPENAGVTITFYVRVGLKVSLNKVKGFRRIREFVPGAAPGQVGLHRATNQVGVYGDFSPNDVGCHDQTFEWSLDLTGAEVAQISDGETVTKQLLVATESVITGYDEFGFAIEEDIDVHRTIRVSVTQTEEPE